jgi:tetratricopeptide (TPR) repeat protein
MAQPGERRDAPGRWDEALRAYDRALALRPDLSATQRQHAVAQAMAVGKAPARGNDEDAAKYRALAERLEREGRRVLADLTRDTARRLE